MKKRNLESQIQVTEQDLEKSRKDFERTSLTLHFGGEIVGTIYYTCFRGVALPYIQNILEYSDNFKSDYQSIVKCDYQSIVLGLAIYTISQIPSFFLKGLAMTKEGNKALAEKFKEQAEEEKQKNRNVSSWLTKKMSELHYHFTDNHEKYDNMVQGYTGFKKKLLRLFSHT